MSAILRPSVLMLAAAILAAGLFAIVRPLPATSGAISAHPESMHHTAGRAIGQLDRLRRSDATGSKDAGDRTPSDQTHHDPGTMTFVPEGDGHRTRLQLRFPPPVESVNIRSLLVDIRSRARAGGPTEPWRLSLINHCHDQPVALALLGERGADHFERVQVPIPRPSCYLDDDGALTLDVVSPPGSGAPPLEVDYLAAVADSVSPASTRSISSISSSPWRPSPGISWQWQETTPINTDLDVDMYGVGLFGTTIDEIDRLHDDGRIVVCAYNAVLIDPADPDSGAFEPQIRVGRGLDLSSWRGQTEALRSRLELAADKGCDGVAPSGLDAYLDDERYDEAEQLRFNRWLAVTAHRLGLSIGLREALDHAADLVDHYDWAMSTTCAAEYRCDALIPFVEAGKAALGMEVIAGRDDANHCSDAAEYGLDWILKRADMGPWRRSCPHAR